MTVKLDLGEFESFGRESPQMAHAAQCRKLGHGSRTPHRAARETPLERRSPRAAGRSGGRWEGFGEVLGAGWQN